jgi:hypothetical protein
MRKRYCPPGHRAVKICQQWLLLRHRVRLLTQVLLSVEALSGPPPFCPPSGMRRRLLAILPQLHRPQVRWNASYSTVPAAHAAIEFFVASADLFQMYTTFCVFGNTSGSVDEMDGSHWAKLCKESGIQNARVPAASVDIVFNKVKTPGRRTINFEQFKMGLLVS